MPSPPERAHADAADDDAFQRAFHAALVGRGDAAFAAQPGFAVYRNTVARGLVDALRDNHPTVRSLVGDAAFDDVARAYAGARPPRDASLAVYGEDFADFLADWLARHAMTEALPYLADVARLDRCWSEAHVAADAVPLAAGDLASLDAEQLAASVFAPHPSARWIAFDAVPAFAIWRRHREGHDLGAPLDWVGDRALLVRPAQHVCWHSPSRDALRMLDGFAAGRPFGSVAETIGDAAGTAFAALVGWRALVATPR